MWRSECAASRLNRLVPREKGAQGQCINMPHWIELSFEDYSQKVSKVAVVEVKSWARSEKC